jgi:hypothetical protein
LRDRSQTGSPRSQLSDEPSLLGGKILKSMYSVGSRFASLVYVIGLVSPPASLTGKTPPS